MPPERIQLRRPKGWRMPENTVKVDRSTRWGNPFRAEQISQQWAVNTFRLCVAEFPVASASLDAWRVAGGRVDMLVAIAGRVDSVLAEIRGKNLACWCKVGDFCHGDVLLEIANA